MNRAHYWLGLLALVPLWLGGLLLDLVMESKGAFYAIGVIMTFVPGLALNVKRCHDRGRSGWFYLVALVPILSLWYFVEAGFLKGDDGENQYGLDPLVPLNVAAETPAQPSEGGSLAG